MMDRRGFTLGLALHYANGSAHGLLHHHPGHCPKEREDLIPPQLLAQNRTPRGVSAMRLKYILRQVEPDRDNLRRDRPPLWILAEPHWHPDAVWGGHIINAVDYYKSQADTY